MNRPYNATIHSPDRVLRVAFQRSAIELANNVAAIKKSVPACVHGYFCFSSATSLHCYATDMGPECVSHITESGAVPAEFVARMMLSIHCTERNFTKTSNPSLLAHIGGE